MAPILYFAAFLTTITGFFIAGCIVAWQALRWLRFGVWSEPTARDILDWASIPAPSFQWIGVQRIVDGTLALPASVAIVSAFLIIGGVIWLFAADNEQRDDQRQQDQLDEELRDLSKEGREQKPDRVK